MNSDYAINRGRNAAVKRAEAQLRAAERERARDEARGYGEDGARLFRYAERTLSRALDEAAVTSLYWRD